jgi:hypothetical protein
VTQIPAAIITAWFRYPTPAPPTNRWVRLTYLALSFGSASHAVRIPTPQRLFLAVMVPREEVVRMNEQVTLRQFHGSTTGVATGHPWPVATIPVPMAWTS